MTVQSQQENSNASPRIVVLGSLNMDMVLRVPHMPVAGETLLGHDLRHVPGGKGGNQAVSCARQGAQVCLLSCVGEDVYAEQLLASLRGDDIDVSHVMRASDAATGVAVISVDDAGQNQIVVLAGANQQLSVPEPLLEQLLKDADFAVLQFETPLVEVQKTLQIARKSGCRVALNPSPMQAFPKEWWSDIGVLVVNETEASALSAIAVDNAEQAATAARQLFANGIAQVVVTLGANGAVVCDVDGARWHEAVTVQAVDSTAAGDTFLGALTVQLAQGATLDEATQWAMRAASICVTRAGAQPSIPRAEEVLQLTSATRWSQL
ncbi:ribokinase [Diaphorobacter sp. HDW4A]|uniref:ribokinase n=1 Tax=Diaphorobacter sp. HDW4A TaxID=2714924 RepID=UPI00140C4CC9|nr:ribokinase [Diaphorobacter sp. HDW4A]QIL82102.1 ribokinase [Diaphorobacter sp. HDW4A]